MPTMGEQDKFMGRAGDLAFEGGEARVDGHRITSFSFDGLRAYADVGLEGAGVGWWELSPEQADLLLARATGLRLAGEGSGA